jgi:hypothetical protein
MTDLIAAAIAAYDAAELADAEQQKAYDAQTVADTIHYANTAADKILGDASESLNFEPIEAEPSDTFAAEADLPGKAGFGIRYTYDAEDEKSRLLLVRPCAHCGHVAVDEIRSLAHLGNLLTDGPTA